MVEGAVLADDDDDVLDRRRRIGVDGADRHATQQPAFTHVLRPHDPLH
jgi:hypothetical protein